MQRRSTRQLTGAIVASLAIAAAGCGGDDDSVERFTSGLYDYSIEMDPLIVEPQPATRAWDGAETVSHGSSIVDELDLSDGTFFFLYGGPTGATLDGFGQERLSRAQSDHGCEPTPDIEDATLDGTAALQYDMTCSGVHIQWLLAVRDGQGLVAVMGSDQGDEAADRADFERLTGTIQWPA
jgi:hypothetical protein